MLPILYFGRVRTVYVKTKQRGVFHCNSVPTSMSVRNKLSSRVLHVHSFTYLTLVLFWGLKGDPHTFGVVKEWLHRIRLEGSRLFDSGFPWPFAFHSRKHPCVCTRVPLLRPVVVTDEVFLFVVSWCHDKRVSGRTDFLTTRRSEILRFHRRKIWTTGIKLEKRTRGCIDNPWCTREMFPGVYQKHKDVRHDPVLPTFDPILPDTRTARTVTTTTRVETSVPTLW